MENKRKLTGAYVWHENEIKRITLIDKDKIILNFQVRVKKEQIKLVKVGDFVKYKYKKELPTRCRKYKKIFVTAFHDNDLISTNKDTNKHDTTHYRHFIKP